ncbi:DMT family transporter [Crenalkalicoccus roseus]|uniref:DMT family transporter n=1 Tax=Crenalkalicoccus roseus TaxID=1485588 RepID=UPI00130522DF|nr:DMT family transporter [Crenalkalicoccus roseus]
MTTAILFLLLANLLYAIGYALAKLLAADLDPIGITFLRSGLVLLAAAGLSFRLPDPAGAWRRAARPPRAWDQRLAAAALVVSSTISVFGYALLPFTEASALGFTGPIILTACGALLLRERVTPRRWLAVALGFAGMLAMLRPGGELFRPEAAVPIAGALLYALYQVLLRRLRGAATETDAMVQGAIAGVVLLGPLMPLVWRTPEGAVLALVLLYTAVQTAALAALAAAMRRGEVSALAPWHYARLVFAVALDAVLFARFPPAGALAGAALIAAGGLLLLVPERRRKAGR